MSEEIYRRNFDRRSNESVLTEPGKGYLIKIGLLFPSVYRVGTANLGFQLIYHLLNTLPGVLCHRFYYPDREFEPLFLSGAASLKSFETNEPLSAYDVAAFSISYEPDILNMIRMLHFSGIPHLQSDRTAAHPLIACGGIVISANPEPLADLMDFAVIGEGEEVLQEIIDLLTNVWAHDRDREAVLSLLDEIPGLYIPTKYHPHYDLHSKQAGLDYSGNRASPEIKRRYIKNLDTVRGCSVIHSSEIEFSDLHLIEISRGCQGECRFCLVRQCYSPFRIRSLESILEEATLAQPRQRIGLLGAGIAHHPQLPGICSELIRTGFSLSMSSMQSSLLNPGFESIIEAANIETITLAPETGTDRLRRKIGKYFSNTDLIESLNSLPVPPIKQLKLYFMIGLPGETQTDLESIPNLCLQIQHHLVQARKSTKHWVTVTASVSCFVPKARTMLERAPMTEEQVLKRKLSYLMNRFKKLKGIQMTCDSPKHAIIQALISRGDRRISSMLQSVALNHFSWRTVFRTSALNPGFFLHRPRLLSEKLPWSFIV